MKLLIEVALIIATTFLHHPDVDQLSAVEPVNDSGLCGTFFKTTTDPVDGKPMTELEMPIMLYDKEKNLVLTGSLLSHNDRVALAFVVLGAGDCLEDNSKMLIRFRNGTELELTNNSKANCDNGFTQFFGKNYGKMEQLKELSSKPWKSIKVWTKEGSVEAEISPEKGALLKYQFRCMLKTLE